MEIDNITYLKGAETIVMQVPSIDSFEEPTTTVPLGDFRVSPWGDSNNLPAEVMALIEKSEVVSSNLNFNNLMTYGQGVKPYIRRKEGNKIVYDECDNQEVLDFFEQNDIAGYFLEQCIDVNTFGNVFPEIILTKDLSRVFSLRHKEATFSRWGVADKTTGEIFKHFYSSKWADGATVENTTVTDVLSRFNPYQDLITRIEKRKVTVPRFIIPINFPSPGRIYYQKPAYWSIFKSGSFDFSTMIWEFKKILLKNGLRIKYVIYISDKYWEYIFKEENINTSDPAAVKARKSEEMMKFQSFLSDDKNAGKGLMVLKKMVPSGSTAIEEKYITIETIKSDIKGGEFLEDSSEVSNIMSYAQNVHTDLIGSNPGRKGSSMSGTDKRELFMIKAAMMAPIRDRLMRPLYVVKKFNKWPDEIVFRVSDYEFTTLDKNKSGKQEVIQDDNQNKDQ